MGFRGHDSTDAFIEDLGSRLANSVQLPSDDFAAYPAADARDCGSNVNYGGQPKVGISFTEKTSTYHARRANEMMRMNMRRFTRPTNGFSKKIENHMHAISFFVMVHNFVEKHGSANTTPGIAAGVTTGQWSIEDILMIADTDTVTFGRPK